MIYLTDKKTNDAMVRANKKRIVKEWINNNGCADFDLKNKDIILFDGGLFSITNEKVMRQKVTGFKKLSNGMSEVIFSKKKYPVEEYKVIFWMSELDETINYFKRMKKMLNGLGYKTYRKIDKK